MNRRQQSNLPLLSLFLCALLLVGGAAEAKNPVVSNWMKNLSYTTELEPSGTVWEDELGDIRAVSRTIHTLWFGRKDDWTDRRLVYRRALSEGADWRPAVVIATESEVPGSSLEVSESAQYLCVAGSTVHIVVPRSFPISATRSWYYNLYYYRSTDNGKTFEPARVLAAGADAWHIRQPRIACNASRVVIGYKYDANWYDNYQIPLLISADQGATFRTTQATGTGSYAGSFEDLALNGTDLYVLHYRLTEPYYYGNFQAQIGLSSSADDGGTFTEQWLTTPAADGRYYALSTKDLYYSPDLAVVGSTVSVVWTQLDTDHNGTKALMFRRSLDKGQTFGPARVIYRSSILAPGQETVAAKGSYVLVTFPTSDNRVLLRRSTDGGASFQNTQLLSTEGGWWPEVQFAPDDASGATLYLFWDDPSYRRSANGGGSFDKVLWFHPAFTTGNYQRSQRVVMPGGKLHTITSAQFYSASLCGGYCDRDIVYRSLFPAPDPGVPGGGLRLYTSATTFEERADNLQVLSKVLDLNGPLSVEVWVKDLGGGIGTGFSDYHTPLLFKQRDRTENYRPAFSIGTLNSNGARRIVVDLETTTGSHRLTAPGDAGLLPPKTWTHLALVYQPAVATNNLEVFKNGERIAVDTVSGNVVPGIGNLFVGRYGNWLVDELRIWAVGLNVTAIRNRMNGPLSGTETGLRAYFNFDGTTADITGKGNDGLLMYKEGFGVGRY